MLIAQNLDLIQSVGLPNFKGGKNIGEFVSNSHILDYVFGAAGIALLIYMVTAGLQMMTSQGDPKAMQGAQAKISNAILGFVIVAIAFLVVNLVGQLFGITQFSSIFGSGSKTGGGPVMIPR